MRRGHVVLVSYGEPPTASFAEQFAYSFRILENLTRLIAAIPGPVIPLIALSRAWGRRKIWREHGYGSPLEAITREQAGQVRAALEAADPTVSWVTHVGYEFRRPLIEDVVSRLPGHEPAWIVPMYVADSAFTHGLSRELALRIGAAGGRAAPLRVLPALDPDSLAALSARHVLDTLAGARDSMESWALILAAHGTLLEPTRPLETGRENTERLCLAIRERLAPEFGMVANGWLNHTRGGRWTEPPIEETFRRVRDAGYSKVAYFSYGFLADNAETQLEGVLIAARFPGLDVRWLPCLNASTGLSTAIAAQVMKARIRCEEGLDSPGDVP